MRYIYIVENSLAYIHVVSKGLLHKVIVDEEDLDKLKGWNISIIPVSKNLKQGYRAVVNKNSNSERYLLHRYLMDVHNKSDLDLEVDHMNGNCLDNSRKTNLRLATPSQNKQNRHNAQSNSKTGILGVAWDKKMRKYRAKVRGIDLGYFVDINEAERVVTEYRANNLPFSKEARRI